MVPRIAKIGLLVLCAAAVNFAAPARSEAQLLYNAWNSIFGGPWYGGGYYNTYYAPSYGYGYTSYYSPSVYSASYLGSTSYYGPTYGTSLYRTSLYAPSCCPTTCCAPVCDPCAPACPGGACASGYGVACAAGTDGQSYSQGQLQPTPAAGGTRPDIPRTYDANGNKTAPMSPMGQTPPADGAATPYGDREGEGFRRREEPMQPPFDGTSTSTDAFRFQGGEEKIPQRSQETSPADGETPDADTQDTGTELRLPPIGLDNKVTWRSAPERTRLSVRSTFNTTTVARAKVSPNGQWTPVKDATKIVKK